MDFALLASDNINLNNGAAAFSLQTPDAADGSNNNQRCYGFGFQRQERAINEEDLRELKMAKTCSSSSCGEGSVLRYPLQRSNGCNLSAEGHHQMLSFSSPNPQPAVALPYYPYTSNAFSRNAVTGINGGSMQQQQKQQGVGMGVRGPFTPSQWMELEHQALIYKYITANVPIPSYLLTPIRKAFESAGFSALRSNPLGLGGWSGFQLGFSNNDPEPGRCRRTDGKKWRCSRDAVIDQKYCERHMNRGRHRSRKPVEPQSNPSTISRGKQNENGSRSEYQHTTTPTLTMAATSPKVKPKAVDQTAFQLESARQEFGLVCSDSLLNPLNRSSTLVGRSSDSKSQHALRQFMDESPKNQPDRSAVDLQADRTQLSISIPMVTSDFMSSTSSPANDKLAATLTASSSSSPPRELEMGLGVGNVDDHDHDRCHRQTNWVPISWERSSIGGPLGEVLHNTNNSSSMGDTKQLNLMDRWDNSPRMATSPTGVLQRGAFASLSNSSAASSPRLESSSHCIGFINPSLPAL